MGAGRLSVTAPDSPNVCPPGHYMLFILSKEGVPSIARIIQIQAAVAPAAVAARAPETELLTLSPVVSERGAYVDVFARRAAVAEAAKGTACCGWHHRNMSLWHCCLLGRRSRGAVPPGGRGPGKPRFQTRTIQPPKCFWRMNVCPRWIGGTSSSAASSTGGMNCAASRSLCRASSKSGMGNSSWRAVDSGHGPVSPSGSGGQNPVGPRSPDPQAAGRGRSCSRTRDLLPPPGTCQMDSK